MLVLVGMVSLVAHYLAWPLVAYDVGRWLLPWFNHITSHGQLGAFSVPFSNYTPPYLYLLSITSLFEGLLPAVTLIKLLSVAGTAALALAVRSLLVAARAERPAETAFFVFIIPSVLLNAPILAQCDAMWSAACVAAVAEAVRRRIVPMLVWCGVAIAFKAQAAFIAPFIIAFLLSERTPLRLWAIPAIVYVAAMAPAWALGWPAADLAMVYLRQAEYFNTVGNASTPWIAIGAFFGKASMGVFWVGYAAALLATGLYLAAFARRRLPTRELLAAALLSSIMLPYLLPKMHERYFFLADILAFAFACCARDRQSLLVAIAVQLASVLAIFGYFVKTPVYGIIGSVLLLFAIIALLSELRPAAGWLPVRSFNKFAGIPSGRPLWARLGRK